MFTPRPAELIIFLFIVLLVLGPKRLPEVGRSLGRGMREFKDSISGLRDDHDDEPPALERGAEPQPVRHDGSRR